jgi:hypothetical protein
MYLPDLLMRNHHEQKEHVNAFAISGCESDIKLSVDAKPESKCLHPLTACLLTTTDDIICLLIDLVAVSSGVSNLEVEARRTHAVVISKCESSLLSYDWLRVSMPVHSLQ